MEVSDIEHCWSCKSGWFNIVRMHVLQSGTHETIDKVTSEARSSNNLSAYMLYSKLSLRNMAAINCKG
jgi:hypothetical protein